jgi:glucan biosynthesis protein C
MLHPQLEQRIDQEWMRLGAIGVAAYAIQLALPDGTLHAALRGVIAWGCTAGLLGAFRGFTFPRSRLFDRVVEASLPVYVLHHLPVVAAAFWVTRLDLPVAAKFALIIALSAAATAALYLGAVQPFAIMRRAFGMKPVTRSDTARAPHRLPSAPPSTPDSGYGPSR